MNKELKTELRKRVLSERRSLSPEEVLRRSAAVQARLAESGLLVGRKAVALYAAADNEVRTREIFERFLADGAAVYLPRVRGRGPHIDFFRVTDWDSLAVSRFGVPEPTDEGPGVDPAVFDLIFVPGVAFDRRGGRLGYGMGCYDRVLPALRPGTPMVGAGYDFQVVESVPMEAHDVLLTAIASEGPIVFPRRDT